MIIQHSLLNDGFSYFYTTTAHIKLTDRQIKPITVSHVAKPCSAEC